MFVPQSECDECRERFTWIDGTPVDDQFSVWAGSEPGTGEKCVRMTNRTSSEQMPLWAGSDCSTEINYACSKG